MAIGPDEAFDEERYLKEMEMIEREIDKTIREEYISENRWIYCMSPISYPYFLTKQEICKRYQQAGWKVEMSLDDYSGSLQFNLCHNPTKIGTISKFLPWVGATLLLTSPITFALLAIYIRKH